MKCFVIIFILISAFLSVHADSERRERISRRYGDDSRVTRDDIVRNMERRRMMLEKMIAESKDKVARHLAGEQVFDDDEDHERTKKRISVMEKKLERMGALDDSEIDRMVLREKRRLEHRRRSDEL